MNKIYFDTNIVIDLFDLNRPFHEYSVGILKRCLQDENTKIYLNSDTITNVFYILRSRVKLSFQDALEKLEFIKDTFTIISADVDKIESAINICKENLFKDYEDALQYICAVDEKCENIITNNPKDFINSSIKILTSKQAMVNEINSI